MSQLAEAKPFDLSRAHLEDYLDTNIYPARLEVTDANDLADAVLKGTLTPDTPLLTFELDDTLYAVPMQIVLSYNVIQGALPDKQPWLMTFCNACNTGMVFDPVVDGQHLHFRRRGAYDGLLLIHDEETASYWQHITGQALHGASQGKAMRQITPTRRMTTAEAMTRPTARLFTTQLTPEQERLSHMADKMRANPQVTQEIILSTVTGEDLRRPRFELGLGMWTERVSAFVPFAVLHEYDNVIRAALEGRRVIVYQHPDAISPVAVYMDSKTAYWEGDRLRLDEGYIQHDVYHTADGTRPLERPTQLLMRWFGFALTFPGCDIIS